MTSKNFMFLLKHMAEKNNIKLEKKSDKIWMFKSNNILTEIDISKLCEEYNAYGYKTLEYVFE